MSTVSTDEQDARCEYAKERLQETQARIVQKYAWIEEIANEIKVIRENKPFTQEEFIAQKNAIAFKERQLNEVQKVLNVLQAKARHFARALEITL